MSQNSEHSPSQNPQRGQQQSSQASAQAKSARAAKKLLLIVFGMFGFGFALVPLYDVFCDITGLNGKPDNTAAEYKVDAIDTSRLVTVQFISRTTLGIPWKFEPKVNQVQVHPGERKVVQFYAKNNATTDIVGQAIPSVSPGLAAAYFQKIECFCFNHQPLQAKEEVLMPLQFYLDPELPADINTVTLSYTLYDITQSANPAT